MSDIVTSRANGTGRAMSRPLVIGVMTAMLILAGWGSRADAATHPRAIHVRPSSGPHVLRVGGTVTLHLTVSGIHLDAQHIGKRSRDDQGHIQLYLDRIPGSAYTKPSLQHWLASVGATTVSLRLTRGIVGTTGSHQIIAALARNDNVLYRVQPATLKVLVR